MIKWVLFIGLIILEMLADVFAKLFGIKDRFIYFIVALSCYCAANASWLYSMRSGMHLWKGVVLFGIIQSILGVSIGVLMGEKINSQQYIGIVVGVVSIILIAGE